jgi:hypothetical protein
MHAKCRQSWGRRCCSAALLRALGAKTASLKSARLALRPAMVELCDGLGHAALLAAQPAPCVCPVLRGVLAHGAQVAEAPRARCAGGRQCCKKVPRAQGHRSPYRGSTDSKACTINTMARFTRQSAQVSRAAASAAPAHAALGMHALTRRAREGVNQGVCTIMVSCSSRCARDHACGLQPAVDLQVGAF